MNEMNGIFDYDLIHSVREKCNRKANKDTHHWLIAHNVPFQITEFSQWNAMLLCQYNIFVVVKIRLVGNVFNLFWFNIQYFATFAIGEIKIISNNYWKFLSHKNDDNFVCVWMGDVCVFGYWLS